MEAVLWCVCDWIACRRKGKIRYFLLPGRLPNCPWFCSALRQLYSYHKSRRARVQGKKKWGIQSDECGYCLTYPLLPLAQPINPPVLPPPHPCANLLAPVEPPRAAAICTTPLFTFLAAVWLLPFCATQEAAILYK